jgi:ribonuclease HI
VVEDLPHVIIWTDGSNSLKAPGRPGGWAAILIFGEKEHIVQGARFDCTNNQAELMACIDGLGQLKTPCRVDIFTDSEYVQKGWSEWLPKWLAHDWVNSLGNDVANREIWQELKYLCEKHYVTFHHVMGHTGIENNERADKLAKQARLLLQMRPA